MTLTDVAGGEPLQLRFSPLMPNHLDQIHAIEQRSHAHPWQRQHLQDSLAHHRGLGVWNAQQLLGYAFYSTLAEEAELLLFVVDQPWQGRGLGAQLLARLVAMLSGNTGMIFLEVRPSNSAALALYEAAGFNEVGRRRNYYPTGPRGPEDALIYALDLTPSPW